MLIPDELRLLHHLAEHVFTGAGCILDCGAFLGGSTRALADGVRRNPAVRGARGPSSPDDVDLGDPLERPLIHSFDRFEVEPYMRGTFFPAATAPGTSFRDRYEDAIAPYRSLIEVHAGDLLEQRWTGEPIELLFVDVAKHWTVCDWITSELFPHLIPGRSIVVQQDYLFGSWTGWLHVTMEHFADYFEYVCDTGQNSVVFRYTKQIPDAMIRPETVASLTDAEKIALLDRAATRFPPAQREVMRAAREQFLEMLGAA
jgi:hypothetical protein